MKINPALPEILARFFSLLGISDKVIQSKVKRIAERIIEERKYSKNIGGK